MGALSRKSTEHEQTLSDLSDLLKVHAAATETVRLQEQALEASAASKAVNGFAQ